MIKAGRALETARTNAVLVAILAVGLWLRLRGLAFGLPALLDPDEPIFVLLGLKLLRNHTLNPGWFGHPGSTTIYLLALTEAGIYVGGHLTGRFPDPTAFVSAIYANPSVVFLPGRIVILLSGLASIWLTWRLGDRLFGQRVGLLAAALLAIDPLHIRYSQIIRTDVQASMFVLLTLLAALGIVRRGRTRDYILTGIGVGLACATKWPAVTVAVGGFGACWLRWKDHPKERPQLPRQVILFAVAAFVALFAASPYLLLDYQTVLLNLHGEARPRHPGATGAGPLSNLWWYAAGPLLAAVGLPALTLIGGGLPFAASRSRPFRYVLIPTMAIFLLSITVQHLVWERWVVPLLPLLAIVEAYLANALADQLIQQFNISRTTYVVATAAITLLLALPPIMTGNAQAAERATDTRSLATAWARTHVPPDSSVTIEYLGFDILSQPWRILFPAGDKGCVDVRRNLAGHIEISTIDGWRGARPVVDLGNIAPARLTSCRADYLIIANWDRYRSEAGTYSSELATYSALTSGGEQVALVKPVPGRIGGPVVQIWRLVEPHALR